jgi:hypothetical protein
VIRVNVLRRQFSRGLLWLAVTVLLLVSLVILAGPLAVSNRLHFLGQRDFSKRSMVALDRLCGELQFYHAVRVLDEETTRHVVVGAFLELAKRHAEVQDYGAAVCTIARLLELDADGFHAADHHAYRAQYRYAMLGENFHGAADSARCYRCQLLGSIPGQSSWQSITFAYALEVHANRLAGDYDAAATLLLQTLAVLRERQSDLAPEGRWGADQFVRQYRDTIFILLAEASELLPHVSGGSINDALASLQSFFIGYAEAGMKPNIDYLMRVRLATP